MLGAFAGGGEGQVQVRTCPNHVGVTQVGQVGQILLKLGNPLNSFNMEGGF